MPPADFASGSIRSITAIKHPLRNLMLEDQVKEADEAEAERKSKQLANP